MKDNTITLQGISFHEDTSKGPSIASYSSTQYVSNITPSIVKTPTVISDAKLDRKDIQVCNINHRYLIITIDKIECIKNCSVLETSFRKNTENLEGKKYKPSGVVLLFMAVLYNKQAFLFFGTNAKLILSKSAKGIL